MFELSKKFNFDAAHSLDREVKREASRRIHGHSYRAEVTITGRPDAKSGMIVDLGLLEGEIEGVSRVLDHCFLNEIDDLGPATMENLCVWIWRRLAPHVPNLKKVIVFRDSCGESCVYYGPDETVR